ncbi:Ribokinase-like protein [Lipomyces chichibuensis]|uniref:Ribokinase-like protein n=1 Tax=Lipomyces chichibuensis TaxID=1546026 RepID=UPI0033436F00
MPFSLLCLGNPLLDIQAVCPTEFLEKYDLKANDAILADEKHMPIYEEILKYDAKFLAGGAAQNTARGAQYVLPADSVVYCGCVGEDKFSSFLREANKKEGLYSAYLVEKDQPTGKCAVIVTGTDRSLVTDLSAANHYKVDHLKSPEIWKFVEDAQYYYVGGYHLTVCVPAILALGQHAAETNKVFSMNLSAPFLAQFFKDQMNSVAPYWDILIGNESEAAAYAESHNLGTTDVTEIAKAIATLPKANTKRPRHVVITQGADSTIVVSADATGVASTKIYPIRPIAASEIIDTNGAGDSFAGGFIGSIVSGKSIDEAVEVGHWLASWTVRLNGPAYPYPKIEYSA